MKAVQHIFVVLFSASAICCTGELGDKAGWSAVQTYEFRLRDVNNDSGIRLIHDDQPPPVDIIAVPLPERDAGFIVILASDPHDVTSIKYLPEQAFTISQIEMRDLEEKVKMSPSVVAFLRARVEAPTSNHPIQNN